MAQVVITIAAPFVGEDAEEREKEADSTASSFDCRCDTCHRECGREKEEE